MWDFELTGFLFENRTTGVPLGLYWWLFGRLEDSEDRILFDFVRFPSDVRSLSAVGRLAWDGTSAADVGHVSLCREEHLSAESYSLEFASTSSGELRVSAALRDIEDEDGELLDVFAEGRVRFTGYVVRPDSLDVVVPDAEAARRLLARFVDEEGLVLLSSDPFTFVPQDRRPPSPIAF